MPMEVAKNALATRPRSSRKPRDRYHHGDLRRALLDEALRTIQDDGVEALTLRAIAVRLGVSRTALYRHFTDKRALLSAVATEGFRLLTERLLDAWGAGGVRGLQRHGRGLHPLRDGQRVALSRDVRRLRGRPAARRGSDAGIDRCFQALVDAIVALQRNGTVRKDDPLQLARFIWAAVHGVSMLIIDGQLSHQQTSIDELIEFAVERINTGIARPSTPE